MNGLDERIRTGLVAATSDLGNIDPEELAARLRARAATEGHNSEDEGRSRRPQAAIAAAVALLAVMGAIGVAISGDGDLLDVTADGSEPDITVGFAGWAPGWHELDTGPVLVGEPPSPAFFEGKLYVSGPLPPANDTGYVPRSGLWSFDPASREWSTLTSPPFEDVTIVATSTGLVAVGGPSPSGPPPVDRLTSWATWSPGDLQWIAHGSVPVAGEYTRAGTDGPALPTGERTLVWTGEVVIDFTSGAVLHPTDEVASPLEMPPDLIPYSHLAQATPLWAGSRAVIVSWSTQPGLAWDRDGQFVGEIPGPPMADPTYASDASAVAVDGSVVLLARDEASGGSRVARFDPATHEWESLPAVPESTEPWCPFNVAPVSGTAVARGCKIDESAEYSGPTNPYRFDGSAWTSLPKPPRKEQGIERWLGTDEALVIWSGDADAANNPEAPYQWAAVWIPDEASD